MKQDMPVMQATIQLPDGRKVDVEGTFVQDDIDLFTTLSPEAKADLIRQWEASGKLISTLRIIYEDRG